MTNATKKPGGWSVVRQQLTSWEKPALLALVKDLYEADAENRDFIHASKNIGARSLGSSFPREAMAS
jgi:hypothetical protein